MNGSFLVEYGKYRDKSLAWVYENDFDYFKKIKNLYFERFSDKKKACYTALETREARQTNKIASKNLSPMIEEVIQMMYKGTPLFDIRSYCKTKFSINDTEIVISKAREKIKKNYDQEIKHLVDLHTLRYEELYKNAADPDITHVPPAFRKEVLAGHKEAALDALLAKEKLLGIHTKVFKIKLNNFIISQKQMKKKEVDFTRLSLKEKIELLHLVEATVVKEPMFDTKMIKTSNIEEAEIIEEIRKIDEIESPLAEAKHVTKYKDGLEKQQVEKGRSLNQLTDKIHQTLEEKILAELEKQKKK